jgi:hypothetical protein
MKTCRAIVLLLVPLAVLMPASAVRAAPSGDKASRTLLHRWGPALTCKPIPAQEPLQEPRIVISLDGLTLHLTDPKTGYDRVFPIGVGKVKHGRILTPVTPREGTFEARLDEPAFRDRREPKVRWAWNYACRFWWWDPVARRLLPVYAGLPFIRLSAPGVTGEVGIHGPAEAYREPAGGRLRRGYVSHGCIRMAVDGIQEVYARTAGKRYPVVIQRAVERRADGSAVEIPERWIYAECASDAGCGFEGAYCRKEAGEPRGLCTVACDGTCPDLAGHPRTFCVADPQRPGKGFCAVRANTYWNNGCKRYAGTVRRPWTPRFGTPGGRTSVCMPKAPL